MTDPFAAQIKIGGTLQRSATPELAAAIDARVIGTAYDQPFGSTGAVIAQMEACAAAKTALFLCADDIRGDQIERIEAACRRLGLAYARSDNGYADSSPGVAFWMPGMPTAVEWVGIVDAVEPYLDAQTIRDLRAAGTLEDELEFMDRARRFDVPLIVTAEQAPQSMVSASPPPSTTEPPTPCIKPAKKYSVTAHNSNEHADSPAVAVFEITEDKAREIIRLAAIVVENKLIDCRRYDFSATWLLYDPDEDDGLASEGEENEMQTECDRLVVSVDAFQFTCYLMHQDDLIVCGDQSISELAEFFGISWAPPAS